MEIDPRHIPKSDNPLAVLSDRTSGFIEFWIKWRTSGDYNHIMWMRKSGLVASQGNTYSEVDISRYMGKNSRLKFIKVIGLTEVQKHIICESIEQRLKLPWHKKMYDWLGIVGQAIGWKWLNISGLNYCSEDFAVHLISIIDYLQEDSPLYEAISCLPMHGSPQDLNEYFKRNPEVFDVYGKWEEDDVENNSSSLRSFISGLFSFAAV